MALSAMAVQGAAQTAFMLVGKVLQVLQEVSKAHRDREKEVQSVRILQGKLQDRCSKRGSHSCYSYILSCRLSRRPAAGRHPG